MNKIAIVIGATGLVGNELANQLMTDNAYSKVKVFVRNPIQIENPKLEQHTIDFDSLDQYRNLITGDVVFCCLGTTIKKAGSQEQFKKVDYQYPLAFAKIAKENNIPKYLLISSLGANPASNNFYLKVKGTIEKELQKLNFKSLVIVRPSMLLGNRKEFRLGEKVGGFLMKAFSLLLLGKLKRYRAIEATDVAKALLRLSIAETDTVSIVHSEKLKEIAKG